MREGELTGKPLVLDRLWKLEVEARANALRLRVKRPRSRANQRRAKSLDVRAAAIAEARDVVAGVPF